MFSFLKPKTFTDSWERRPGLLLRVDLKAFSLNGIRPGSRIDQLSFLGKTEAPAKMRLSETLYYYTLGIAAGFDSSDEQFCDLRVVWVDYLNEGFSPFPGTLTFGDKRIREFSRDSLLSLLGEPYASDTDECEELLFYEVDGMELQLEFDLSGQLKQLILTDDPLLNDPEQREAYGLGA